MKPSRSLADHLLVAAFLLFYGFYLAHSLAPPVTP